MPSQLLCRSSCAFNYSFHFRSFSYKALTSRPPTSAHPSPPPQEPLPLVPPLRLTSPTLLQESSQPYPQALQSVRDTLALPPVGQLARYPARCRGTVLFHDNWMVFLSIAERSQPLVSALIHSVHFVELWLGNVTG